MTDKKRHLGPILAGVLILLAGLALLYSFFGEPATSARRDSSQTPGPSPVPTRDLPADTAGLVWETHDFTYRAAPDDEKVLAVFRFKNAGTQPVTIRDVKTTCGCLSRKLEKQAYEPAEEGKLEVEFRFGSRVGKQTKKAIVYTDEPQGSPHTLRLLVDIPELVKVWPKFVYWGTGEPMTPKKVTVQFEHDTAVHITGVKPANASIFTEVEVIQPGKKYEVAIAPAAETSRPRQIAVTINTDLPYPRLQKQVVYARVIGPRSVAFVRNREHPMAGDPAGDLPAPAVSSALVRLEPDTVSWDIDEPAEPKTIRVIVTSDEPVNLERVAMSSDSFVTELEAVTPGREYRVTVTPTDTSEPAIDMLQLELEQTEANSQQPIMGFAVVANDARSLTDSLALPPE